MRGCSRFLCLSVGLAWLLLAVATASAQTLQYGEIVQRGAVAYEAPDPDSPAIRLLYEGEIVSVAEKVVDDRREWYRIRTGADRSLYVPVAAVGPLVLEAPTGPREPDVVLRDQYPLGVGALAYGVTHGAGVQLRYLPITRAGITFNIGPILDDSGIRGLAQSWGLATYIMTGPFTPVLEFGYAFIMSEAQHSRQRMQAIYVTAGLEWMFSSGVFVSVFATYLRSTRVENLFPHDDKELVVERYGPFDATGLSSVQRVLPGGVLGYAF